MSFHPEVPYNDLPDLPPSVELETKRVLKRVIAATRALAELKGVGGVIPDQRILVNGVVLQEARASSEIENIVTTTDELYRALDESFMGASPGAKEVLRYREALWRGYERLDERPVGIDLMLDLVRTIVRADAGIREAPGTRIAPPFGETIYTPPEGADLIRAKLANLEAFIHADNGLDPLVKLAVMHYQFEAIHPFADGNGRTGRVLNSLYLVERGLLDLPVLYLSGFILERRGQYYDLLRRVTEEGAWEDWIVYMLEAVEVTAADTRQRISDIRGLMGDALARAKDAGIAAAKQEMIELIFHQPYCKIGFVTNGGLAKRETASRYLRELEALGLLRSIRAGRDTYYVNDALISVLRRAMESATP